MPQKDEAVLTAAVGYVFVAPVGTAAPTPTELAAADPETYGAQEQTLIVTGAPTGGTFTLKNLVGDTPAVVAYNATAHQVETAIEGLASVGSGNVSVTGVSLSAGYSVKFVGKLYGTSPAALTVDDALLTGGTVPNVTATVTAAPLAWVPIGHTSRDSLPEFGYDGGDTKIRGSWQKQRLREVLSGDPIADNVKLQLEQFDPRAFELYYGTNGSTTPGVYGVTGKFEPVEKAFLTVIVDGDVQIGLAAAKSSIKRDSAVKLEIDNFAMFPIKVSFLDYPDRHLYEWINEDLFA